MTPTWEPRFHKPDQIELATATATAMTDRPDLVAECDLDRAPAKQPGECSRSSSCRLWNDRRA